MVLSETDWHYRHSLRKRRFSDLKNAQRGVTLRGKCGDCRYLEI